MLLFCPACSNMLTIAKIPVAEQDEAHDPFEGQNRFECRTCPYQYRLTRTYFERHLYTPKKPEDILGGSLAWANVDKTDATCPNAKCDGQEAFFKQVQTRSADEPMTNFFRCVKCTREWMESS